jgi:wobble nucleotide-excising tRNase
MIRRIKRIKELGIFSDFVQSADVQDFSEKNIIYGWNYSGKTTLSRLFALLDDNNPVDADYSTNVKFELQLSDSNKNITQEDIETTGLLVRVFNSDFIKSVLRFDSDDKKMAGIAFDVGGGVKIREEIEKNKASIVKGETIKSNYLQNTIAFAQFEDKFTKEAKRIKNDDFNSLIEFNKAHLRRCIEELTPPINQYTNISVDELHRIKAAALEQNVLSKIQITKPVLKYTDLLDRVIDILKTSPIKTTEDSLLSEHRDLFDWAKSGLDMYSQNYTEIDTCAFCGNVIEPARIKYLNEFYSNEAARLVALITQLNIEIDSEIVTVGELEWSKMSSNDITGGCRLDYDKLKGEFSCVCSRYIELLNLLKSELTKKAQNHLFNTMELCEIDESAGDLFSKWLDRVEAVFTHHNEVISKFNETQKNARNKYERYLVASFLCREDYFGIQEKTIIENRLKTRIDKILSIRKENIIALEGQLKSFLKGQEQLNAFIKVFLNREDILIATTPDDYFVLKRGEVIAKNLSEGEKTAIAFSYFMVMLESLLLDDKLKDTIVFIDDPISSLDANHLAQVSALINSFFFRRGLDKNNPEKITNCFKQLFISTHNFDLYSFLKNANNIKRKKRNSNGDDIATLQIYLLKRISADSVNFVNMPKALSKYNSEYVYLFSEIINYKELGFPVDKGYMMPNVIRRFLEMYTLSRLPGNTDEIDNRVKILIEGITELKILHTFSHLTAIERMMKHNELLLRIEDIVSDLLLLLSKDPAHLESLYDGIGRRDLISRIIK